jgi:hypothetical protein
MRSQYVADFQGFRDLDGVVEVIDGRLFTRDFLLEGICETPEWQSLSEDQVAAIHKEAKARFEALAARRSPNEAQTEDDLVYPLLELVGWNDRDVQPNASVKARLDVPDALLYPNSTTKALAGSLEPWARFQHGLSIVEAKRWGRPLDREIKGKKGEEGTPSSQIMRYLRRVDDRTMGKLRWGMLTNGRVWRLYFQGATSVAEDFLEIDLGKVLSIKDCDFDLLDKRPDVFTDDRAWRNHIFRLFIVLFGRSAFLANDQGQTFHQSALQEGKKWESKVAQSLSKKVFDEVFPSLADGIAKNDPLKPASLTPAYLAEVRQGALFLLYRILFVLYAEDRNLLPDEQGPYAPYCLTRIRLEIADRKATGAAIPKGICTYWPRLTTIFAAIADGNDDLGIPPYNGGLFDRAATPILSRVQLPDNILAEVVFGLSHEPDESSRRGPKYINYRDLSVQQLGAVYEGILEYGLRATEAGSIEIDADDQARHKSGSYYTPEALVALIIERAVGPLVKDRLSAFRQRAETLAKDTRPTAERLNELAHLDPALAILSLKVCDPAMGSGHFLVSLVDWLSDKVLDAKEEAIAAVTWADYASPLAERIETIRDRILEQARARSWPIVEAHLDDKHVVRRMVLKRSVYGVDKNPMAVELAKVALWLHSFTVGAPLSFLDHHLRAGDSVVGAFVRPTLDLMAERGALFSRDQIVSIENVSGLMAEIEQTTDNDIAEVHQSKSMFGSVSDVVKPVSDLFSLLTAERMLGILEDAPKKAPDLRKLAGKPEKQLAKARADLEKFEKAAAFVQVLDGTLGKPIEIASGQVQIATPEMRQRVAALSGDTTDQDSLFPDLSTSDRRRVLADALVTRARNLTAEHGFFHWEIGFPAVWSDLTSAAPRGGFDAVIGNPPYVRQELLGAEVKRALKAGYTSFDGMADLYVYFYEQGLRLLKPGGRMSYVVTNKWLKAGYAEELRGIFADKGWLEFIADFGHAKHFFPGADVFPCVLVVQRPLPGRDAPESADVCVIPRDLVPRKGLHEAVTEATFPLPRLTFTREAWVLEPKPVMDLLDKIRANGVPLAEYARVKPLYGIKTGLNEAFLINSTEREKLVYEDPSSAQLIRPYLRGQDIDRWHSPDSGLHMIVLKSSGNFPWPWANAASEGEAERTFAATYPGLHKRMQTFENTGLDPKTGKPTGLRHREDQGRYWWELRACDYYEAFDQPKVLYVDITWSASFSLDMSGRFTNNTGYFIPTGSQWLTSVLNAPIGWHFAWRKAQHGKDEALRYFTSFVETYPIPPMPDGFEDLNLVPQMAALKSQVSEAGSLITNWLRHEFSLEKPGPALSAPHTFDADGFATAVRATLPKRQRLSAADIQRLKDEHKGTIEPARVAAAEALSLERRLSDLVNAAYGLTSEEVKLMWDTAPPRMPFTP